MVEVPPPPATTSWQKSSMSGQEGGACVHIAGTDEHVWIRDSKNPLGHTLGVTREEWAAFLVGVQSGEYKRSEGSA